MSSQPFVHLHCHSHYSLLDGQSKIPDLIDRVKSLGMPAVALTDHGNLFGAIEFLREAKAAGIVPIVGIEAYVAPGKRTDRTSSSGGSGDERYAYHLTLLAQRRRLSQSASALVAVVSRGLLLQAQDRQGDPRTAQRGADLPVGMRRLRILATAAARSRDRGREAGHMVLQDLRGGELLRRGPEQRLADPARLHGASSTWPDGSDSRWWPPATPTI